MRSRIRLLTLVVLASVARFAHGDREAEIRLAIVDLDHAKSVPSAFLDILLVELSRHPGIALLERDQIALILKEQELNLSLTGDVKPSAIVRSGRILSADAILMLRNDGDSEDAIDLRLRLVDARHGLKLLDSSQTIESRAAGYEEKSKLVAASVLQHTKRMNVDPDQLLLVGVSTFKSEEMARRWDWLSDVLPANIEQNLALYPGISLIERTVTRPLTEERAISSDLPAAITASAILLDGAYRIDRTREAVLLSIRATRDRHTVFETTTEGSLNQIEQFCAQVTRMVVGKLRAGRGQGSMDAAVEAKMLAAEAASYLSRNEHSRALPPAESAHALMPQSLEYSQLIIRALMGEKLSPQAMVGDEQIRLAKSRFRVANLAERIMRTCPLPSDKNLARDLRQDVAYLHMHLYAMEKGLLVMSYCRPSKMKEDDRHRTLYAELSRNFWRLFEVCHDRYVGKSSRLHERLLYRGSWALNLTETIGEAIRRATTILTHQVTLDADLYAIRGFVNAVRLNWQGDDDALAEAGNFLATLRESSRPEVQSELKKALGDRRDWRWRTPQDTVAEPRETDPAIEKPEAASGPDQFSPVLVFSAEDRALRKKMGHDVRFRRLGMDKDEVTIVYSLQREERYGVIRLDRRNARLLTVHSPQAVRDFRSRGANDHWEHDHGPAMVVHEGDVYLAFVHAGFLVLKHDGTTLRLNEATGLAYNNIRHLERLGDRLFCHVGASRRDSGLMELDLVTGRSNIITSTRVEKARCELDHRAIGGMAADPRRGVLWVLSGNRVNTGHDWNRLYRHSPTSGDFERITTPELDKFLQGTSHSDKTNGLRIFGDSLVIFNGRGLCELNLATKQTRTLVDRAGAAQWRLPRRIDPTIAFALVERGLVCVSFNQLLYFQKEREQPTSLPRALSRESKSDKLDVRDLAPTAEGLYVLTPEALYLIAGVGSRLGNAEHPAARDGSNSAAGAEKGEEI